MKITANNKKNTNVEYINKLLKHYYDSNSYKDYLKIIGIDGNTYSANDLDSTGLINQLPEKDKMNNLSSQKGARAQFNGSYNKRPVYTEVNIDLDLKEPEKSQALGIIQEAITHPDFEFTCSRTQEKGKVWGTKPAVIRDDKKMFVYNRSIGEKSISEETSFSNEGYLKAQCKYINKKLADAGIDHQITYEIDNQPSKDKDKDNDNSLENANNSYFEEKGIVYDEQKDNQQIATETETMKTELEQYKQALNDKYNEYQELKQEYNTNKQKLNNQTVVLSSAETVKQPDHKQESAPQDSTPQEQNNKGGLVDKIRKKKNEGSQPSRSFKP